MNEWNKLLILSNHSSSEEMNETIDYILVWFMNWSNICITSLPFHSSQDGILKFSGVDLFVTQLEILNLIYSLTWFLPWWKLLEPYDVERFMENLITHCQLPCSGEYRLDGWKGKFISVNLTWIVVANSEDAIKQESPKSIQN